MAINPGDERLQPRSSTARLALLMRGIVAGFAVVVVAFRYGVIVASLSALCGGLLVVVARRRKAQPVPGALWSASADLLQNGKRWPGQLSVLGSEVVWAPSKYSVRGGLDNIRVDRDHTVRMQKGSGLTDVQVTLASPTGKTFTLLTYANRRLAAAVAAFNEGPR